MSLNYLGLGFSFGVEDLKLKDFQAGVSEGFLDMSEKAAKAVESAKPFVPSFEAMVPKIDAATDAVSDFGAKAVEGIERAGEELKRGQEKWTEFREGVTETVNEWKSGFEEVGSALKTDVQAGFERLTGAVRGLVQTTGIDQVGLALTDLKTRVVETGQAMYQAADAAFGISKAVEPIKAVATKTWEAAKSFLGMQSAAEAASRAVAIDPQASTEGVMELDKAVQQSTGTFSHDLPVAMEAASRSYHKEATRIIVDSEHIKKMFKEIKDFGESLKSLVSLSKLQTIFQGLGTGLLAQVGKMKQGIGSLLQANVNLTTGLEAEGAASAKSAKAIGAQRGLTGAALRQFTGEAAGMASSLNMDASTTANALAQYAWAQKEFAAVGITSASQLAKAQESLGMDASEMAKNLRGLREQFKFSDEDLNLFVGGLQSLGATAMDLPKAMQLMPRIMEDLGQVTDETGKLLRGADLATYQRETVAAMGGFYAITQDLDKAAELALGVSSKIGQSREEWHQLFTGAGKGFPDMAQKLMRMGVQTDEAFRLMQSGPDGFMRGMAEMAQSVIGSSKNPIEANERMGQTFAELRGWMGEAFDPQVARAFEEFSTQMMGPNRDAILAQMQAVKQTESSLGKLADESHSTGRTLQESFDRTKEAGVMGFRAISRAAAVDFVQGTGKAFGQLNAKLQKVAAGDGPMAGIVKQLSLMHQIGAYALIPESLRPMAVVFGEIGRQILPLLGSLAPIVGPLGAAFVGMSGPMMLITAAAGALVVPLTLLGLRFGQLMLEGKTFSQALDQIGKDIQGFADTAVDKLYNSLLRIWTWMQGVDLGAVFTKMFKGLEAAITGKGSFDLFDWLFGGKKELKKGELSTKEKLQEIQVGVPMMFDRVRDAFIGAAKTVDWGGVATGILSGLLYVFIELPNEMFHRVLDADWPGMLKKLIEGISSSMASGSAGGGIGDVLVRALVGVADLATWLYQVVWKVIKTGFELLQKVDWSTIASNLWTWMKGVFTSVAGYAAGGFDWLANKIPEWVRDGIDALGTATDLYARLGKWVGDLFDNARPYVKKAVDYLFTNIPKWFEGISAWLDKIDWLGLIEDVRQALASAFISVMSTGMGLAHRILKFLFGSIADAVGMLPGAIKSLTPKMVEWIRGIPQAVKDFFSTPEGNVGSTLTDAMKAQFKEVRGTWGDLFKTIFKELIPAVASLGAAIVKLLPVIFWEISKVVGQLGAMALKAAFKSIGESLSGQWDSLFSGFTVVGEAISGAMDKLLSFLEKRWGDWKNAATTVLTAISKAAKILVTFLTTSFRGFYNLVVGWFRSIQSTASTTFKSLEGVWDTIKTTWDTATAGIKTSLDEWMTWLKGIWDEAREKAGEVASALLGPWERVSAVMAGFRDKAKDFFQPFIASAISFGKSLVDKFRGIVRSLSQFLLSVYEKIAKILPSLPVEVIPKAQVDATIESLKAMSAASDDMSKSVNASAAAINQSMVDKFPEAARVMMSAIEGWARQRGTVAADLEKAKKALAPLEAIGESKLTETQRGQLDELTTSVAKYEAQLNRLIKLTQGGEAMSAFNQIASDTETAGIAIANTTTKVAELHAEVYNAVGNSIQWWWHDAMNVMNKASEGTTSKLGEFAGKIGDVEGVASAAFAQLGDEATSLNGMEVSPQITPVATTDVLQSALVQPWLTGARAAELYALAASDSFAKVLEGADGLKGKLEGAQLAVEMGIDPAEAFAMTQALASAGNRSQTDSGRRSLEELAQGPMREILLATNNPAWYSDWRTTFLKAHEELKAEIRALRAGPTQNPGKSKPMPTTDVLASWGLNGGS